MTDYFVALDGNNGNSGLSTADAFGTVAHGVEQLDTGDTLFIRGGVYFEHVKVECKTRITIQSMPGEHAVIDGARKEFRAVPNGLWDPGEVAAEFVTRDAFPLRTDRGAFVLPDGHVRLVTYSRLEDLRADNEMFGPLLPGEGPDGPDIVAKGKFTKRPWVYMGPGIHQGDDRRIHLRLRHTHLDLPGIRDYDGPEDPATLPLAIWTSPEPTLRIEHCQTVHVEDLTVRFGGGRSIRLEDSTSVFLDHVNVLAGPYGLEVAPDCDFTTITNCRFDGGLPPWYFRSDRKDGYTIADGGGRNGLGEQTLKTLVYAEKGSSRTTYENCEFTNAHDIQLNGPDSVFRRNWVHNVNDDAIYVGDAATNLRISGNVFEKTLTVLSLASKSTAGPVYLHRNLIDLRRPTAGRRPQPVLANIPLDEQSVMRFGNMFKSNFADPDLTVFHNTVVINQSERATFNLFRSYDGIALRRAFNNIFLGIDNAGAVDRPLAYLPRVSDNAETDGNCYYGINREPRVLLVARPEKGAPAFRYQGVQDLRDDVAYFDPSEIEHPPGFEANGTSDNPRLRRFTGPLHFPVVEDLRLAPLGSAEHGGVKLLDPVLHEMDGNPPDEPKPDIGCYPFGSPPLAVGVDGLRLFPSNPVAPPPPSPL